MYGFAEELLTCLRDLSVLKLEVHPHGWYAEELFIFLRDVSQFVSETVRRGVFVEQTCSRGEVLLATVHDTVRERCCNPVTRSHNKHHLKNSGNLYAPTSSVNDLFQQ